MVPIVTHINDSQLTHTQCGRKAEFDTVRGAVPPRNHTGAGKRRYRTVVDAANSMVVCVRNEHSTVSGIDSDTARRTKLRIAAGTVAESFLLWTACECAHRLFLNAPNTNGV